MRRVERGEGVMHEAEVAGVADVVVAEVVAGLFAS
jgi:hypothetical protein